MPHTTYPTGPLIQKSCDTIALIKNAMKLKNSWPNLGPAYLLTTRPSTHIGFESRQAEFPISCRTYKVILTSCETKVSNLGNMQKSTHTVLGQRFQSNKRVILPPKLACYDATPYFPFSFTCSPICPVMCMPHMTHPKASED